MSIAGQDLGHDSGPRDPEYDWGDGPAAYEPGNAPRQPGDRTPPQDNAAEQSVLGAMLHLQGRDRRRHRDAARRRLLPARARDDPRRDHRPLRPRRAGRHGHRRRRAPAPRRAGQRIGGAPYLHTLSANVPIAANAGLLRRDRPGEGDPAPPGRGRHQDRADRLRRRGRRSTTSSTRRRPRSTRSPTAARRRTTRRCRDIMDRVLDEIEAIGNREAGLYGVPTGFADLDDLTNGLHSGQMIIVAARPAMGKALALDTPLATPTGWTTMGEVAVGDQLYDAHGRPTRSSPRPRSWPTGPATRCGSPTARRSSRTPSTSGSPRREPRASRSGRPTTTTTARATSGAPVGGDDRADRVHRPARRGAAGQPRRAQRGAPRGPAVQDLPIRSVRPRRLARRRAQRRRPDHLRDRRDPDVHRGCGLSSAAQADMLYSIRLHEDDALEATRGICVDCGATCSGARRCAACHAEHSFTAQLRRLGVLGDKHIPLPTSGRRERSVVRCSPVCMDTDGTVVHGRRQLPVRRHRSSGWPRTSTSSSSASVTAVAAATKRVQGRSEATSTCYILNFSTTDDVFRLERKHLLHKEERPTTHGAHRPALHHERRRRWPRCRSGASRSTTTTTSTSPVESMIPTHNSTLALDFCRAASIHNNLTSVFFSLEMTRSEITMRLLSAEAKVPLNHIRNGQMGDEDWDAAGPQDGRGLRGADVHRRLAQHDDDGDPGQGAAAQAAPRPASSSSSTTCS